MKIVMAVDPIIVVMVQAMKIAMVKEMVMVTALVTKNVVEQEKVSVTGKATLIVAATVIMDALRLYEEV